MQLTLGANPLLPDGPLGGSPKPLGQNTGVRRGTTYGER